MRVVHIYVILEASEAGNHSSHTRIFIHTLCGACAHASEGDSRAA